MRSTSAQNLGFHILCAGILATGMAGCGSSQGSSPPTPTAGLSRHTIAHVDRKAVQAATAFLQAFKADNRNVMLRLMSRQMRERNRHEYVQHMLGVQSTPARIDIVRAHTFRGHRGAWTRVVARLQFDHGTSTDAVAVVHTIAGYRIANVKALKRS